MNKFLKILALTAMLVTPFTALAQGGDDPISGIDIIVKKDPGSQPIKPFGLTGGELKKYNSLKASDRAVYLSKIVAGEMNKISEGASPKGGWQKLLQTSLAKNWCSSCKVVTFTVHTQTEKAKYKITFKPKTNGSKPAIVKIKAKAAVKSTIKK
ncbi:MAG: hypothetical protein HRU28_12415 [Rhizobiales bacterium]|nr:hypothetical protein [Hyphomicrobiales bacterium]